MKKTISATVESIADDTLFLLSDDNKKITLPISGVSDITVGQQLWVTISTDEPNDAKVVLNTILGNS